MAFRDSDFSLVLRAYGIHPPQQKHPHAQPAANPFRFPVTHQPPHQSITCRSFAHHPSFLPRRHRVHGEHAGSTPPLTNTPKNSSNATPPMSASSPFSTLSVSAVSCAPVSSQGLDPLPLAPDPRRRAGADNTTQDAPRLPHIRTRRSISASGDDSSHCDEELGCTPNFLLPSAAEKPSP